MILPLLLSLQAAVPPPLMPAEDEIVVIARKMRMIKADIRAPKRKGQLVLERCRITRSSGDAELDAIPCAVAQACMSEGVTSRKQLADCTSARASQQVNAVAAARRAKS